MFRYLKNRLFRALAAKPRTSKAVLTALVAFVLLGINVFAFATPAQAGFIGDIVGLALDPIVNVIASIMLFIATILGKLLVVLIDILLNIVKYNDFTNARAVEIGWVVVRDLCNMFFIVVLLIIAFGTIFRIENYKYNRLLPKLILMAVLINFSKLIAGFLIDLGQVVMMTFVNAFADAAATNFTSAFKLQQMLGFLDNTGGGTGGGPSNWSLLGGPFLAIMLLIVALMVMLAMVVVFLTRIIMLWILVAVSPLAFLLEVLPGGSKYAQQWWSKFGQWVTTGPILAFFLWLSLAVLSTRDIELGIQDTVITEQPSGGGVVSAGLSAVSTSKNMVGFMFSIAMMLISLSIAGGLGGVAGSVAGKMTDKVRAMGSAPFRSSSLIGKGRKALTGYVGEELGSRLGIASVRDKWKEGWQRHRERTRRDRISKMRAKAAERGGVLGTLATPTQFFDQYWGAKGIKRAFQEGIGGKKSREADNRMKTAKEKYEATKEEADTLDTVANGPTMHEYRGYMDNKRALTRKFDTARQMGSTLEVSDDADNPDGIADILAAAGNKKKELEGLAAIEARKIKEANDEKKEIGALSPERTAKLDEDIKTYVADYEKYKKEAAEIEVALTEGKRTRTIKLKPEWEFTAESRKELDATIGKMEAYYKEGKLAKSKAGRDELQTALAAIRAREEVEKRNFFTARQEADRIRPAFNFEMLREQALDIAKEKSEMLTDSWQELWEIHQDAERRGDSTRAAAAYLKATEYANDNEIQNMAGDGSGAEGLKSFIMNRYVGKKGFKHNQAAIDAWETENPGTKIEEEGMGLSEAQALNIANLVSYAAEKAGHWMNARAVGVENGKQFWQKENDRLIEQIAEIRKIDPETFQRRVNRLGWGIELPKGGEDRAERARNFQLTGEREFKNSPFALAFFEDNWKRWEELLSRGRFNESVALSITSGENYDELKRLAAFQKTTDVTAKGGWSMERMVDEIKKFGASRSGDPFRVIREKTWMKTEGGGKLMEKEYYTGKPSPDQEKELKTSIPGIKKKTKEEKQP
ncbi:MAG: hypothetical protein WC505_04605 [Patescibacteria group bacterium]